eukprot:6422587-Pyramimonas_sp.AAC.1
MHGVAVGFTRRTRCQRSLQALAGDREAEYITRWQPRELHRWSGLEHYVNLVPMAELRLPSVGCPNCPFEQWGCGDDPSIARLRALEPRISMRWRTIPRQILHNDQVYLHLLKTDVLDDIKQLRRAAKPLPSWRSWPDWSAPDDTFRVMLGL